MTPQILENKKSFMFDRFNHLKDANRTLKLMQWLLPVFLFLTATAYEIYEHGINGNEEFILTLSAEIIYFGISGPVAVAIAIGYIRILVKSETDASQKLERLNRDLESKVEERTALLAERNQQLDKVNQQLKQVDEMKSEFVSLVSHELRGPLTALNGGLEVALQSADTLPAASRRILEAMINESERLTRFVQTILDVSRIEAGSLTLNLGPVAVAPILHRSAEVTLSSRRVIRWNLPDKIPPVWADEIYYEQIIRNLLLNADKYSPPESPIFINIAVDHEHIRVEVVDQGSGIPLELQEKIYERFQRGQNGESAPPGWGLGLYFAKKLAEAQGGTLTLLSPYWPDSAAPGSAFTICLPVAGDTPEDYQGEGFD